MRTTLTIDRDLAALIEQARRNGKKSLKQIINEALRLGLTLSIKKPKGSRPYKTMPLSLGRCLIGNVDDISEVLAVSEGESYK